MTFWTNARIKINNTLSNPKLPEIFFFFFFCLLHWIHSNVMHSTQIELPASDEKRYGIYGCKIKLEKKRENYWVNAAPIDFAVNSSELENWSFCFVSDFVFCFVYICFTSLDPNLKWYNESRGCYVRTKEKCVLVLNRPIGIQSAAIKIEEKKKERKKEKKEKNCSLLFYFFNFEKWKKWENR